jgi:hypothetical protein
MQLKEVLHKVKSFSKNACLFVNKVRMGNNF